MPARFPRPRRRQVSVGAWVLLALLLILPALALWQLARTVDWRLLAGGVAFVGAVAFLLCYDDKQRAERGEWRRPETTLHFWEMLGGWPAAFLAQRIFRHKVAKAAYQAPFWTIVVLHQAAAFDYLNDWRWFRAALALVLG